MEDEMKEKERRRKFRICMYVLWEKKTYIHVCWYVHSFVEGYAKNCYMVVFKANCS